MFETIVVMFLFLAVVFLLFSNFSKSKKLNYLETVLYDSKVRLENSFTKLEVDMRSKMKSLEASPSEDTTASNEEYEAETFESDDLIEFHWHGLVQSGVRPVFQCQRRNTRLASNGQ